MFLNPLKPFISNAFKTYITTFIDLYHYVYRPFDYVIIWCSITTWLNRVVIIIMKDLVVKDNALINASYNLDLVEQRLVLLAI